MIKKIVIIIFVFPFITTSLLYSDKIYLKNNKIKTGFVKNKTAKVLYFLGFEGEEKILIDTIKNVVYDNQEENYMLLGTLYIQKKRYNKALFYYKKALRENPKSKQIQESILRVRELLFKKKDNYKGRLKKSSIREAKRLQRNNKSLNNNFSHEGIVDYEDALEDYLGLTVKKVEKGCEIIFVDPKSSANERKLHVGDKIVSIWDKEIKDFNLETIQRILLGRSGGRSIRIKIQRRVVILRGTKYWFQNIFKLIDAELNFIDNQLIVSKVKKDGRASLAGIKNGDIVINLDKIKPEYLVGDNLEKYIEGEEYSKLELIIERDVILRKK